MSEFKMIEQNINILETLIPKCQECCKDRIGFMELYPDFEAWTLIGITALKDDLKDRMAEISLITDSFEIIETSFRAYRDRLNEQDEKAAEGGMRVDLNASRKRAVKSFDAIVKAVEEIIQEKEFPDFTDCNELKDQFDGLRSSLVSLAYSYIPDDPDFRDLSDEIGEVSVFMKEEE